MPVQTGGAAKGIYIFRVGCGGTAKKANCIYSFRVGGLGGGGGAAKEQKRKIKFGADLDCLSEGKGEFQFSFYVIEFSSSSNRTLVETPIRFCFPAVLNII